jgi:uncharacterized membrane protein
MQSVARLGQKGSASVFFAISAVPLLAVAGLVIDGGNVDFAHRRLQGTTDLAAIAAAANLPDATAAAQGNAAINGYNVADVTAVTPGIYTPSAQIPPSQRFQPSSLAAANAVQVTMTHQQPLFTTPIFQLLADSANVPSSRTLVTQAIAATDHYISFGIGSGVASLNGGIVNGILDQTIGTQVSLSLIDYQSLASAQVDLFGMSQAIAAQVGQVGETYGQSVNQTISTSAFFQAIAQAAPSIAPLMTTLANDASLGAGVVDLSRLISFGPYADFPSNGPEPQANITASAWQLVQAAMQLNGSPHLINLNLNSGIPGIATVTGMMTLGEPAQYSTLLSVNQTGTSVHTSQIRLFLDITLGGAIDGAAVQLPLYLEVGYGTATFNSLSCNALDPSQTQATLDVAPGLVNGWIGNVTAAQMVNFQAEPTVTPATLLNILGLASVTGAANAKIGNPPAPVTFNASDIANATIKTSSTTDFTASLINSLLGNLTMQVNALGAGVQLPGLTQQVAAALAAGASPADTLLTGVLQTTGLGLGQASTWITGARCSAATIVG